MKKILIIGAGYGGLRAMEHLAKNPAFHVTLVDQNPYHYMQTEAYGYIAGRFDFSDIAIDLQSITDGLGEQVHFVKDKAIMIDKENKIVKLETQELHYDYLIVSVGARTNFFSFIKGAEEFTHGVKNIKRAFGFRQAFEERLYLILEEKKLNRDGDLHIAIAGAGLSGVEIAAEMANTLRSYEKILLRDNLKLRISLIDAAETILPGMDAYIIQKTQKRLEDLGVKIHTNAFIQEIQSRKIIFQDANEIAFDFIIYTAGIKGSDFTRTLDTNLNRMNQIIPDSYLRIEGYEDIFSIGDCTQITDAKGNMLPPTAQIAEKSAEYVAKSILMRESNEALTPFDAKVDGLFVALGGKYAVGVLFDKIKVDGYLAYLLKKVLTRFYRFGLELKVNVAYKKRR